MGSEHRAYELTAAAAQDLHAIALHSIREWGTEQARRYGNSLEEHFDAIGCGKVLGRSLFTNRPELLYSRCQRHFIFYLLRKQKVPLIVAVLHEKMDLSSRIAKRLG